MGSAVALQYEVRDPADLHPVPKDLTDIDLEQAIRDKLAVNYNRDWSEE